jgi:Ca-activated chloride channel family protein
MKRWLWALVAGALPLVAGTGGAAAETETVEGKLSPYFFVQGDPGVDAFPLLKTEAKVGIAGVISEVELTQVYKNDGEKTIEAVYVFPLGVKSAIHAMRMTIGERVIEATIEEKGRAAKIYDTAKQEGKVASLLEQERPNVFQMKVANIMPGDRVEVLVKYTELLVPEKGIYEFVFPTVVGPRFTGESKAEDLKGQDNWSVSPYLHEGKEPPYEFKLAAEINAGMPLSAVSVTSHKVALQWPSPNDVSIALDPEEKNGGNRDFILRYSLQGEAIHSGLLLYPGETENHFLLMVEPPKQVKAEMVPPREYLFIVDVSGSMHGFPLSVSQKLIGEILDGLKTGDYFNVMFFSGGADVLADKPLPANEENKRKAIAMLQSQQGSGGTQMLAALNRALALSKQEGLSRTVVIATDGYVTVEKEVFDLIREKLGAANFFAFGIGTSVNRYLIEGIARAGRGEPFVATNEAEAQAVAEDFRRYIETPLLTDIRVRCDGFDAYDVEPPSLPDLFAARPLVLFGKYRSPKGAIVVTGKTPSGGYEKRIEISPAAEDRSNTALPYLWARERIARLSDYGRTGEDVSAAVTELGLAYHLMTEYTSFVAVDTIVRPTGETVTVKQPLPLPQGVSDYAVGQPQLAAGVAAAPMGSGVAHYKLVAREEKAQIETKTEPQVYLEGGSLPKGITLEETEKLIAAIKSDLEKSFQEWELAGVTVTLKVEKGIVTEVKVKEFQGKKCQEEILAVLFKKLAFPAVVTGNLELTLRYN